MEIKPISIPHNIIRDIPPPSIRQTPPPVVSTLERPVVDVPSVVIDYPTIDVPTEEDFQGQLSPPPSPVPNPPIDTRNLPSCLLYTSPSPRDGLLYRMPSSA